MAAEFRVHHSLMQRDSSGGGYCSDGEDLQEAAFARRGCCCWGPFFPRPERLRVGGGSGGLGRGWWERMRAAEEEEERWWSRGWRALRRLREWSEISAGPRWKTFIRRFNRGCCGGGGGGLRQGGKFQYDPLSYALNFDDGPGQNGHFDDFSARYGAHPATAKPAADRGKEGVPFT